MHVLADILHGAANSLHCDANLISGRATDMVCYGKKLLSRPKSSKFHLFKKRLEPFLYANNMQLFHRNNKNLNNIGTYRSNFQFHLKFKMEIL